MKKFDLIKKLDEMEKYHRIQYKKVKNMRAGVESTNPTSIQEDDCEFGKWLINEKTLLLDILGEIFYLKLKTVHNEWHEYYKTIYNCYYKMTKKGFFSKQKLLFNANLNEENEDIAKNAFLKLEYTSNNISKHIDICRKRMYALPQNSYN